MPPVPVQVVVLFGLRWPSSSIRRTGLYIYSTALTEPGGCNIRGKSKRGLASFSESAEWNLAQA